MRRIDLGRIWKLIGEPVGGPVLRPGELIGPGRIHQVGAAHRAEEQGPAGEDGDLLVADGDDVGQVRRRVAGGVDRRDRERSGGDALAVADAVALEANRVVGVENVGGATVLGECQPARDVVVVNVRLEHVGDRHVAGHVQHAVDVALGIDDDGDGAVGHEIGPVPEARRFDDANADHPTFMNIFSTRSRS